MGKERKKVLYFNEKNSADFIKFESEIVDLWNQVSVEAVDEATIEEYLHKQGIASMKDAFGSSKTLTQVNQRKSTNKGRISKRHNEHLSGLLNEYDPNLKK